MEKNLERRHYEVILSQEERAIESEDGKLILRGYASVFNQNSKLIYDRLNNEYFYERINPDAFNEVLQSPDLDTILVRDHNPNLVMARFRSGAKKNNLSLSVDEKGLLYEAKLSNVTVSKDTWEYVRDGVYYENSFAFTVADEEWSNPDENGYRTRTIKKIGRLFDVSVVLNGAYSNTDVIARGECRSIEADKIVEGYKKDSDESPKIVEEKNDDDKTYEVLHKLRNNEIELI